MRACSTVILGNTAAGTAATAFKSPAPPPAALQQCCPVSSLNPSNAAISCRHSLISDMAAENVLFSISSAPRRDCSIRLDISRLDPADVTRCLLSSQSAASNAAAAAAAATAKSSSNKKRPAPQGESTTLISAASNIASVSPSPPSSSSSSTSEPAGASKLRSLSARNAASSAAPSVASSSSSRAASTHSAPAPLTASSSSKSSSPAPATVRASTSSPSSASPSSLAERAQHAPRSAAAPVRERVVHLIQAALCGNVSATVASPSSPPSSLPPSSSSSSSPSAADQPNALEEDAALAVARSIETAVLHFVQAAGSAGASASSSPNSAPAVASSSSSSSSSSAPQTHPPLPLPSASVPASHLDAYRLHARQVLAWLREPGTDDRRMEALAGRLPASAIVSAAAAITAAAEDARFQRAWFGDAARQTYSGAAASVPRVRSVGEYRCERCGGEVCDVDADTRAYAETSKAEVWGSKDSDATASWARIDCVACSHRWRVQL